MSELNIQQKNIINQLKQDFPELRNYSDEQILSIYNQQMNDIQLSKDEQISIMSGQNNISQDFQGLKIEFTPNEKQKIQILEKLKSKIDKMEELTTQAEDNNSVVGHVWSWMKNNIPLLDKITDSSNEVRVQSKKELDILNSKDIKTAFEEITGVEFNQENVNKFLDSNNDEIKTKSELALEEYKIGQNDSADFVSDMLSGMGSMIIYSGAIAAVVAAGAPFALAAGVALGCAALLGAGLKVGLKAADSALGGKKYEFSGKDVLVGGLNGVLAPLTAGFGGRIATSAVTKLGGTVVKEGAELVATNVATNAAKTGFKQFTKEALMNPMGNFYHGKLTARLIGYGTELGFDGGVSGAIDAGARTAYDGGSASDIASSAISGGIGGAIGGMALGGIFKYTGNKSHQKGVEIGENIRGKADIETPSISDRIANASTREDFSAISKEIKAMPEGAEKEALKVEYVKRQQEWNKHQSDVRMEYKPEESVHARVREELSRSDVEQVRKIFEGEKYFSSSEYKKFLTFVQENPDKKQSILDMIAKCDDKKGLGSRKSQIIEFIISVYMPNSGKKQAEMLFESFTKGELAELSPHKFKELIELNPEKLKINLDIISTFIKIYEKFPYEHEMKEFLEIKNIENFSKIKPIFNSEYNLNTFGQDKILNNFEKLLNIDERAVKTILSYLEITSNQTAIDRGFNELLKISEIPEDRFKYLQEFLMNEKNKEILSSPVNDVILFENVQPLLVDLRYDDKTIKQALEMLSNNHYTNFKITDFSPEQIDCFYRYLETCKKYDKYCSLRQVIEEYSSLTIEKFNAIVELLNIPAKTEPWSSWRRPQYSESTFEKIKVLDDSCLKSIVKIGTLMKDGEALLHSTALEFLMEQDPEYINLIVKRFLENPNADVDYLYRLIDEPLNKLKNPKLVLSSEEQAIETMLIEIVRSDFTDIPMTKLRKLCSNKEGYLDEILVKELNKLSETFGLKNSCEMLSMSQKDGSIDVNEVVKITTIIKEKLYSQGGKYDDLSSVELYSFAQKYGDGFEDVLDSLMDKFRVAAIFDNGKSYLTAKDSGKKELTEMFEEELVQESRIASKKLSDFIKQAPADKAKIDEMISVYDSFYNVKRKLNDKSQAKIDNLFEQYPEQLLEIMNVISKIKNHDLLNDILDNKSIELEDLAKNIGVLESLESLTSIGKIYNFEYKKFFDLFVTGNTKAKAECVNYLCANKFEAYSFEIEKLLEAVNEDNLPILKKIFDKYNGKEQQNIESASIREVVETLDFCDSKEKISLIEYIIDNDLAQDTSYNGKKQLNIRKNIINSYPGIVEGIRKYGCPEMYTMLRDNDYAKGVNSILATFDDKHKQLFYDLFKKIKADDTADISIDKYFCSVIKLEDDFRTFPTDRCEFLLRILKDVEVEYSDNFDANYKLKPYLDLARKINPAEMDEAIKLLERASVKDILSILKAKSTYNKEAYDILMKYLYMENSPLNSSSIKAILEQPYDKEFFDFIIKLIKNPNEDLHPNFAAQFVRFGKEGLQNLETFLETDDMVIKMFKGEMQSIISGDIDFQPICITNEMLTEIRTKGARKSSFEIFNFDKITFNPELFKKLYRLYDSEGNHIISETEIHALMKTPEIAAKVLNEATDAIKKIDLSKVNVTQDMVDDFIQNLSNEFKVLLFDKNGNFTIDSYKKLLNKLNDNQFLREALANYEKTGKIDLSAFEGSSTAYTLLSPSAEFSKLLKIVPEVAQANPENFYKLYSDIEIIRKQQLEQMDDYITKNPARLPNFMSKQGFLEYCENYVNSDEYTAIIAKTTNILGLDRMLKVISGENLFLGKSDTLGILVDITSGQIAPSLKKVIDMGISESEFDMLINIAKHTKSYKKISIEESEFIDILERISAKGKFDKVELLNLVYDKFLMSSIDFKSLSDEQLKIVADFDLIMNKNISAADWYDFVSLSPEMRNSVIQIMNTIKFKNIKDIINISDADIAGADLRKKIELVSTINELTDDHIRIFEENGIPIREKIDKISKTLDIEKNNIQTDIVSQKRFLSAFLGNNNPKLEKAFKSCDFDSEIFADGIPMKYSRHEFSDDVMAIVSDLSADDKALVYAYFNIQEGADGFDGIPMLPQGEVNLPKHLKSKVDKITEKIIQFTTKNEVLIDDKDLKEMFDAMVQGLPEFAFNIGKKQHSTHHYTVDIHSLKVLQYMMNDPDWVKLSDEDKFVAKFAVLVHDFGKKGAVIDHGHADLSADFIVGILDKFKMPESTKFKIIEIVQNHHWFEKYNKGEISAEQAAALFRFSGNFEISKLFAKGDLSNVSDKFHHDIMGTSTSEEFETIMSQKFSYIAEKMKILRQNSNFIFDRKILANGEKFPTELAIVNGKKEAFKVLNLSDKSIGNLERYGFPIGTTVENLRFFIHMPSDSTRKLYAKTKMFNFLSYSPHFFSAQSTTLMKATDVSSYGGRQFGLILDVDQANISSANFENFGSGTSKGLDRYTDLLFKGANKYVKDKFYEFAKNKGYEMNDELYGRIGEFLHKKKHITSIYNEKHLESKTYVFMPDGTVKIEYPSATTVVPDDGGFRIKAKDLREILETSEDALYKGYGHNEIVPVNPRITGLIAKVSKIEDCPEPFLQYAKENDLPIILVGNSNY